MLFSIVDGGYGTFPATAIFIYTPVACGCFCVNEKEGHPSIIYLSKSRRNRVPSLAGKVVVSQPEGSREGIGVESGEV